MQTCCCFRYLFIGGRAPVTIQSLLLLTCLYRSRLGWDYLCLLVKKYSTIWHRQQLIHPGWQRSYRLHRLIPRFFRLNRQRLRLSLDLQVLVLPVPLPSSTAVTAHASPKKNLLHGLDIANPFPPDLWGYVHRFGHQPEGLIAPFAHYDPLKHTIKAQSLEAILPAIIFIHDVYVSLLEQDTIRKGRVYEMYEMYEIAEALPVTPNGLHPRWLDLWQSQFPQPIQAWPF